MTLLFLFLSGMFLANGIPHFVKGISGQTHMTPFKRVSSSALNVIWAFINFFIGLWFFKMSGVSVDAVVSLAIESIVFLLGALFMAISCAWLFSKPNAKFPWHKD